MRIKPFNLYDFSFVHCKNLTRSGNDSLILPPKYTQPFSLPTHPPAPKRSIISAAEFLIKISFFLIIRTPGSLQRFLFEARKKPRSAAPP